LIDKNLAITICLHFEIAVNLKKIP
jgi:hypothetical protein